MVNEKYILFIEYGDVNIDMSDDEEIIRKLYINLKQALFDMKDNIFIINNPKMKSEFTLVLSHIKFIRLKRKVE